MSVKIDRYSVIDHYARACTGKAIYDFYNHETIVIFSTTSEELNQELAEMILDELNTGKYEEKLKK